MLLRCRKILAVTLRNSCMFKVIVKKWFWFLLWALTYLASFTEHCLLHLLALPPKREEETSSVPIAKAVMDSNGHPGYRSAKESDSQWVKSEGFHRSSESDNVTVSETAYNAIRCQHAHMNLTSPTDQWVCIS